MNNPALVEPSQELVSLADVEAAASRIEAYIRHTELQCSDYWSSVYQRNVLLKREDQQVVRSFKLRGAFNFCLQLTPEQRRRGVVCASAGNHAQGIAYACRALKIPNVIFLPANTPRQKIEQVKWFGQLFCETRLVGQSFFDCEQAALSFAAQTGSTFAHPFDDADVIAGQGTLALETIRETEKALDAFLVPVGGGGLVSGVAAVVKALSPQTRIIGVEVQGADALSQSLRQNRHVTLPAVDSFADGTAVSAVGKLPYQHCQQWVDDVLVLTRQEVSQVLIDAYNKTGLILEPSGALSVAAVMHLPQVFHNVCCIVSGANNDAARFAEFFSLLQA